MEREIVLQRSLTEATEAVGEAIRRGVLLSIGVGLGAWCGWRAALIYITAYLIASATAAAAELRQVRQAVRHAGE